MKARLIVVVLALAGAATYAFWPANDQRSTYPFAQRIANIATKPLWGLSPEALENATKDDAQRLDRIADRLKTAVDAARAERALLNNERPEDLPPAQRARVREIWWSIVEPVIAIDELKARYDAWFGVDYVHHADLHARAYGLTFAALCAQASAGQTLMEIVKGNGRVQRLFDEAMPEYGLPSGTFSAMRRRMVRTRDYSYVHIGSRWYDNWIARHLQSGFGARIRTLVNKQRDIALRAVTMGSAPTTTANEIEVLKSDAFARWFPVQRNVAEWFGDTRVAPENRRLIRDAQLAEMKQHMQPGDIIVERRNWYLSNVGLPGFWPHAALYAGTPDDIHAMFDTDAEVTAMHGKPFTEYLAATYPQAWRALNEHDHNGHAHNVMEAVSEGVVAASLEHSCGADYVGVMRPNVSRVHVARALERAMHFYGRPYDFNFDFATDDQVVCSELVMKAYEPENAQDEGLRVPAITVAGRRAIPPTEIVRVMANERGQAHPQLSFVWFLDGRERERHAIIADEAALCASVGRPKWDLVQP